MERGRRNNQTCTVSEKMGVDKIQMQVEALALLSLEERLMGE